MWKISIGSSTIPVSNKRLLCAALKVRSKRIAGQLRAMTNVFSFLHNTQQRSLFKEHLPILLQKSGKNQQQEQRATHRIRNPYHRFKITLLPVISSFLCCSLHFVTSRERLANAVILQRHNCFGKLCF